VHLGQILIFSAKALVKSLEIGSEQEKQLSLEVDKRKQLLQTF
jgi:hypothetical protein